jgi:predicted glutamine amidotransferase
MHVTPAADEQQVSLVASVPPTDEEWQPFAEGEIVVVSQGISRARVAAPPLDKRVSPNA